MVVCKACGFENVDVAEICNKCNATLKEQLNQTFKKENLIESNRIASFIKILSIVVLIFGLIASLVVPAGTPAYYGSHDFGAMFSLLIWTVFAFAGLRGFAEIIEKLHRSEIHQKRIYELMSREPGEE